MVATTFIENAKVMAKGQVTFRSFLRDSVADPREHMLRNN